MPSNFASVFCHLFLSLTDISHYMASRWWLCQMPPLSPGRNHTENVLNTWKKNLKDDAQRVQRRSLSCIFPWLHYSDPLQFARLELTRAHQESLTEKLIQAILRNPSCKIFSLLLPSSNTSYELRKQKRFAQPMLCRKRIRTTRGLSNIWGVFPIIKRSKASVYWPFVLSR